MRYISDFIYDMCIFCGIYIAITLVLSGIVGWTIAIVVIYLDNNWIPLIILTISTFTIGLLCCIINAFSCYLKNRRSCTKLI
jgi:hypothetical protein